MTERFRLKQGGIVVAWTNGPGAYGEILHYAAVYGQDAPVLIEQRVAGRWKAMPK
jgi:hypothetical protein